jgi:hypothetical protein
LTPAKQSSGGVFTLLLASAAVVGAFWEMIDYNLSGEKFSILRAMLPVAGMGALLLLNYVTKPA